MNQINQKFWMSFYNRRGQFLAIARSESRQQARATAALHARTAGSFKITWSEGGFDFTEDLDTLRMQCGRCRKTLTYSLPAVTEFTLRREMAKHRSRHERRLTLERAARLGFVGFLLLLLAVVVGLWAGWL